MSAEPKDNVTQFPQEQGRALAPVNYSVIHTLPGGRQISATTSYFPIPGEKPDAMLDDICRSMDRIRVKYEIGILDGEDDTLNSQIALHKEQIERGAKEIARLDEETTKKIADLRERSLNVVAQKQSTIDAMRGEIESDGRRSFDLENLRPGERGRLAPYEKVLAEVNEDIKKLEDERAAGHKNHAANMAMFAEKLNKYIAKRDARVKFLET